MYCSAFEIRNSLLLFYLHLKWEIISKLVGDKVHFKQLNGVAVVDGRGNALGAQASRKNEHVRAVGSSSADSYRTWCVLFHSCRSTALERPHYANLCVGRMLSYSVRLPRLAPGVPAGIRVGEFTSLIDLLPTFLDIAQVAQLPDAGLQGYSLAPFLKVSTRRKSVEVRPAHVVVEYLLLPTISWQ